MNILESFDKDDNDEDDEEEPFDMRVDIDSINR